jgi:hypothetical protein
MEPPVCQPARYRASGKVRWIRFVPFSALALAVSFGMAWCLHLLFVWGYYILVFAPLVASIPVLIFLSAAVVGGHCRCRIAAGGLGLLAAAVLCLGHFHADVISVVGWQQAHRLDLLPRYINFRMKTDVQVDVIRGNRNAPAVQGPDIGRTVMNWFVFVLEFGMVAGISIAVAVSSAGRVYCDAHQRWYRQEEIRCQPGMARPITEALEMENLVAVASEIQVLPRLKIPCCVVKLEYCPESLSNPELPEPIYLSVNEIDTSRRKTWRSDNPTLAKQWELSKEALAVFVRFFSGLRSGLGLAATTLDPSLSVQPEVVRGRAEIAPVPAPYGGTILTRRHILTEAAIGLSPTILALAACAALISYGVYFRAELGIPHFIGLGGATGVLLVGWIWYGLRYESFLPSVYIHRVARHEFRQRPDSWVDADNPDALYVQVIPRSRWTKIMLENAADLGFLLVDQARRVILFEGDRERWRIPAEAVISCDLEYFSPGSATEGPLRHCVAVLRARTADGIWEAPLTQWHIRRGKRTNMERQEDAEAVQARILDLAEL